jgi:hypothetical protein
MTTIFEFDHNFYLFGRRLVLIKNGWKLLSWPILKQPLSNALNAMPNFR